MVCKDNMNNQFNPFIEEIQKLKDIYLNNIDFKLYYNLDENHSLISKDKTITLLKKVLNNEYELEKNHINENVNLHLI